MTWVSRGKVGCAIVIIRRMCKRCTARGMASRVNGSQCCRSVLAFRCASSADVRWCRAMLLIHASSAATAHTGQALVVVAPVLLCALQAQKAKKGETPRLLDAHHAQNRGLALGSTSRRSSALIFAAMIKSFSVSPPRECVDRSAYTLLYPSKCKSVVCASTCLLLFMHPHGRTQPLHHHNTDHLRHCGRHTPHAT